MAWQSQPLKESRVFRIGVDVGGTNTDAVAVNVAAHASDNRGVVASFKTPTTSDITTGIEIALKRVLETPQVATECIASVTVGTTHFINAIIERDARRLRKVAVIRLSKSFLREVPPFSEFPPGLTNLIRGYVGYIDGGLAIDGSQEAPVVEEQVVRECHKIKTLDLAAVVIVGVFSPIDEVFLQEEHVREIMLKELSGVDIVCSHEVANIGFMERENASILNAAILKYARRTVKSFRMALRKLKLTCSLFLTQNDGTLLDASSAAKIPIKTFASGATNSMRGAAYLAGFKSGRSSTIVVDIGGTSSDVGVLLPSFLPRQASAYVTVAGIRVNYSMPHLHSVGLGGGSLVREVNGQVQVGPDSVGHYLTTKAKVFGGETLTATDVTVAGGRVKIGDSEKVEGLNPKIVTQAEECIRSLLEGAIDAIKTSPDPLSVLLVGGGSVLAPSSLKGASEIIRPPFYEVANAVGAAISKVGGTVDIIQGVSGQTTEQAVEHATMLAVKRAVAAGAIESTVSVVEVESIPMQYITDQLRTIVKAVGDLNLKMKLDDIGSESEGDEEPEGVKEYGAKLIDPPRVNPLTYRPSVIRNGSTGIQEWQLSETDLDYLADGCYVLGCAGGGSTHSSKLMLRGHLREGHKMRVIDHSQLSEDAKIYWGGMMGSPATSAERLQGLETVYAVHVLMEYLGDNSFDAFLALEIGGSNGLQGLLLGSSKFFDVPVVDADFMGRAYPTLWQTTIAVHEGGQLVPCSIDSGDGKSFIMTRTSNNEIVDRALRAVCTEMGSRVGLAMKPTTTDRIRNLGVLNTMSLAWRIGRCIARAEATNDLINVAEAIVDEVGGSGAAKILFRGKIVAVERRLFKGHSFGSISIVGLSADEEEVIDSGSKRRMPALATGGIVKIPFKNENILAEHTDDAGNKRILATVPDLICVLDTGSGRALGVPEFKYGFRVTVLGIACSPRWTDTKEAVQVGGPQAFGYDIDYQPLGTFVEPKSVILEYAPRAD